MTRCTYCFAELKRGQNKTKDHIFPRKWYPTNSDPHAQRPTVYACSKCNARFKMVEDRLRRCWGLTLAATSDVAQDIANAEIRAVNPLVGDSIGQVPYKMRARNQFFRDLKSVPWSQLPELVQRRSRPHPIVTDGGIVTLGNYILEFTDADVDVLVEKMVRGMFQYQFGRVLPKDGVSTFGYLIDEAYWREAGESMVSNGFAFGGEVKPAFRWFYNTALDDPNGSIWYFYFWRRIVIFAGSVRSDDVAQLRESVVPGGVT